MNGNIKLVFTQISWLALFLILSISPLYSQQYFNVRYPDGTYRNKTIDDVNKITFSNGGSDVNFYLSDGTIVTQGTENLLFSFSSSGSGTPLPVELVSFSVRLKNRSIQLNWSTASEVDNFGFDIERRQEPSPNWQSIAFINGSGNSNSPREYTYIDSVLWGKKVFYRLKQTNMDGTFSYSNTVNIAPGSPTEFQLRQNYPNPFNPTTTISYSLPKESKVNLTVYNSLGEQVAILVNEFMSAGDYEIAFGGNKYPSGIYIYRLSCAGYTKSIRMLLLK